MFKINEMIKDEVTLATLAKMAKGKVNLAKKTDIKKTVTVTPIYAKKAYCQLQPLFKRLHIRGKEEIGRAISSGADPDYILKSSREMGKREPVFQWRHGELVFIPKHEREAA